MKSLLLATLLSTFLLSGCKASKVHPLHTPSAAKPIEQYSSFDEHLDKTDTLISESRYFLTDNPQLEIKANLPFEIKPQRNLPVSKSILLIHGLGDSPWSFVDVGQSLAEKGFLVRTVLLPGHGTRPADMINADQQDWQALIAKQVALLKQETDEVYLGGFSTGGNLAYLHAACDPEIKGLTLFSPGFESDELLIGLTPTLARVKTWLAEGDPENTTNYVRYSNMPVNGFAQYYLTSKQTLDSLENNTFKRPVFMVLSEHDSVLEVSKVREIFEERFTHKDNRLLWLCCRR